MPEIKLALIKLADWFDDRILGHRFYWVCQKIGLSSWWGHDDDTPPKPDPKVVPPIIRGNYPPHPNKDVEGEE